jgi:hypothetical protein
MSKYLHKAEAGLRVDTERVALHDIAVGQMQPDGLGFGDQIADRQHKAVADQHAVAGALHPERIGSEGIGRDNRMQADHRRQRTIEIVGIIFRPRLHPGRHFPFDQCSHWPSSPLAVGLRYSADHSGRQFADNRQIARLPHSHPMLS